MLYSVELRSHFSDGKDRNFMYSYKPDLFIILDFLRTMQQYTTYILYSESLDAYYIGFTGDAINTRLLKHLSDHKGFTGRAKDWKIAYTEIYSSKSAAMQREKQLKSWKNKIRIKELIARKCSEQSIPTDGREGFRFES